MMVKRLFVVFLSLSLIIVPCLVVSVSAESTVDSIHDAQWMNVMPFLTVPSSYSNLPLGSDIWIYISDLPAQYYRFYDVIFRTNDPNPRITTENTTMTVVRISDDVYRAFGWGGTNISSYVDVRYRNSVGNTYFQLVAFNVSIGAALSYPSVGSLQTGTSTYPMSSPSSPVSVNFPGTSIGSYIFDKNCYVYIDEWYKFDYVDVLVSMRCVSVDSVVAMFGNTAVPFSCSVLEAAGSDSYIVTNNTNSTQVTKGNLREFTYLIRLDLRSLERIADAKPYIYFNFSCDQSNANNWFQLNFVTGYLDTVTLDIVPYFFQKVRSDLSSHFVNLSNNISTGFSNLANRIDIGLAALGNNITDNFIDLTSDLRGWFTTTFDKFDQLINPDAPETDQAIDNAQDNISSIEQIESDYAADLDSSVITGQVDKVQNYGNALVFCSSILSRSFANLGGYQIIYVMPVCIGIFLFVASRARVPSAPKSKELSSDFTEQAYADALKKS